jgi:hypothetical protein
MGKEMTAANINNNNNNNNNKNDAGLGMCWASIFMLAWIVSWDHFAHPTRCSSLPLFFPASSLCARSARSLLLSSFA